MSVALLALAMALEDLPASRALVACARREGKVQKARHATHEAAYTAIEATCARQAVRLYKVVVALNLRAGSSEGDARINAGDTVSLTLQDAIPQMAPH
jgi:hypothetical protein